MDYTYEDEFLTQSYDESVLIYCSVDCSMQGQVDNVRIETTSVVRDSIWTVALGDGV